MAIERNYKDRPNNHGEVPSFIDHETEKFIIPVALINYLETLSDSGKKVRNSIGDLIHADSVERVEQIISNAYKLGYINRDEENQCFTILKEGGVTLSILRQIDEKLAEIPDPMINLTSKPIFADISIESVQIQKKDTATIEYEKKVAEIEERIKILTREIQELELEEKFQENEKHILTKK